MHVLRWTSGRSTFLARLRRASVAMRKVVAQFRNVEGCWHWNLDGGPDFQEVSGPGCVCTPAARFGHLRGSRHPAPSTVTQRCSAAMGGERDLPMQIRGNAEVDRVKIWIGDQRAPIAGRAPEAVARSGQ